MRRDHRVEDIASQAQLSAATVDRVLHGRPGVSSRAVRAVEQAVLDLDRQQTQLRLRARTVILDVVIQAPQRFSSAYREAVEAQLGSARPAAVRARFRFAEHADAAAAVAALHQVGARGRTSHDVLLKAPDDPEVARAVRRLADRGVPVVTLVTDIHASGRIAYVGLDNRSAGATAAYLVARWLGDRRPAGHLEPFGILRRERALHRLLGGAPLPGPTAPHRGDHGDRGTGRHPARADRGGAPRVPVRRGRLLDRWR